VLGSHLLSDAAAAFALAQPDPRRSRMAYWLTGSSLFVAWNGGVAVGALGGRVIADPNALGLDAAFPAALVALLLPALREPRPRRVALVAAPIAVAAAPFVPAGVPVLLALAALPVALLPVRPMSRSSSAVGDPAGDAAEGRP
jgi:predicted branched-subunit amino acid permease